MLGFRGRGCCFSRSAGWQAFLWSPDLAPRWHPEPLSSLPPDARPGGGATLTFPALPPPLCSSPARPSAQPPGCLWPPVRPHEAPTLRAAPPASWGCPAPRHPGLGALPSGSPPSSAGLRLTPFSASRLQSLGADCSNNAGYPCNHNTLTRTLPVG